MLRFTALPESRRHSFFIGSPAVSDDCMAERATRDQPECEPLPCPPA